MDDDSKRGREPSHSKVRESKVAKSRVRKLNVHQSQLQDFSELKYKNIRRWGFFSKKTKSFPLPYIPRGPSLRRRYRRLRISYCSTYVTNSDTSRKEQKHQCTSTRVIPDSDHPLRDYKNFEEMQETANGVFAVNDETKEIVRVKKVTGIGFIDILCLRRKYDQVVIKETGSYFNMPYQVELTYTDGKLESKSTIEGYEGDNTSGSGRVTIDVDNNEISWEHELDHNILGCDLRSNSNINLNKEGCNIDLNQNITVMEQENDDQGNKKGVGTSILDLGVNVEINDNEIKGEVEIDGPTIRYSTAPTFLKFLGINVQNDTVVKFLAISATIDKEGIEGNWNAECQNVTNINLEGIKAKLDLKCSFGIDGVIKFKSLLKSFEKTASKPVKKLKDLNIDTDLGFDISIDPSKMKIFKEFHKKLEDLECYVENIFDDISDEILEKVESALKESPEILIIFKIECLPRDKKVFKELVRAILLLDNLTQIRGYYDKTIKGTEELREKIVKLTDIINKKSFVNEEGTRIAKGSDDYNIIIAEEFAEIVEITSETIDSFMNTVVETNRLLSGKLDWLEQYVKTYGKQIKASFETVHKQIEDSLEFYKGLPEVLDELKEIITNLKNIKEDKGNKTIQSFKALYHFKKLAELTKKLSENMHGVFESYLSKETDQIFNDALDVYGNDIVGSLVGSVKSFFKAGSISLGMADTAIMNTVSFMGVGEHICNFLEPEFDKLRDLGFSEENKGVLRGKDIFSKWNDLAPFLQNIISNKQIEAKVAITYLEDLLQTVNELIEQIDNQLENKEFSARERVRLKKIRRQLKRISKSIKKAIALLLSREEEEEEEDDDDSPPPPPPPPGRKKRETGGKGDNKPDRIELNNQFFSKRAQDLINNIDKEISNLADTDFPQNDTIIKPYKKLLVRIDGKLIKYLGELIEIIYKNKNTGQKNANDEIKNIRLIDFTPDGEGYWVQVKSHGYARVNTIMPSMEQLKGIIKKFAERVKKFEENELAGKLFKLVVYVHHLSEEQIEELTQYAKKNGIKLEIKNLTIENLIVELKKLEKDPETSEKDKEKIRKVIEKLEEKKKKEEEEEGKKEEEEEGKKEEEEEGKKEEKEEEDKGENGNKLTSTGGKGDNKPDRIELNNKFFSKRAQDIINDIDKEISNLADTDFPQNDTIIKPYKKLLVTLGNISSGNYLDTNKNIDEKKSVKDLQLLQNQVVILLQKVNELNELYTTTPFQLSLKDIKDNTILFFRTVTTDIKQIRKKSKEQNLDRLNKQSDDYKNTPNKKARQSNPIDINNNHVRYADLSSPESNISNAAGVVMEMPSPIVHVDDTLSIRRPALLSLNRLSQSLSKYKEADKRPFELRYPKRLDRIYGIIIGKANDEIYLLGDTTRNSNGIYMDDIIVAFQSICKERVSPSVSLDPEPGKPEGPHWSRIDGCPPYSFFARQMLDADYEMKLIQMNKSATKIPDGLLTYARLVKENTGLSVSSSNRFWLCPFLPYILCVEIDNYTTLFLFNIMVRVKTQNMLDAGHVTKASGEVDILAERAALSFSDYYNYLEKHVSLGQDYYIFHLLRRLFDLVSVCSIINRHYNNSKIHERIATLPINKLDDLARAPRYYEGIGIDIFSKYEHVIRISGGVDMGLRLQKPMTWKIDDSNILTIHNMIMQLRNSHELGCSLPPLNIDTSSINACEADDPITKAETLIAACKGRQAHDVLTQAIKEDPLFSEAYAYLAVVDWKMGDYDSSKVALQRACKIDGENPFVKKIKRQFIYENQLI